MTETTRGITPADIRAAADVVRAAGESADSIGFEEAADLRVALLDLQTATKDSLAVLSGELLRMVEAQPRRHDGFDYSRRPKTSWRFDHELIRHKITDLVCAADHKTGEVPDVAGAVGEALELHADIYVSPSSPAKVGGLRKIGLEKKQAGTYENQGYELDVVDTMIREDAE
jgi:hypothetical protein